MNPRASIIICVYNRGRQVQACLESLLALDFQDYEIVLVDDASTDDSLERLVAFQQAHPEKAIQVVRNERNLGVSGARNSGLDAARGEFVFFTDSDCRVEPDWVGAFLRAFADPEVVGASGLVHDHPPRSYAELANVGVTRVGREGTQQRALVGCNMAFRRAPAVRYRFEPELRYGSDEDEIAWRMEEDGWKFAFAPDAVAHHDHPMRVRDYWKNAIRQGQGSARYWYKRGVYVGRDLWFLALTVATLPLALFGGWFALVSLGFLLLHLFALLFNQVAYKGKSWPVALAVLPLDFVYFCIKGWTVSVMLARIAFGLEPGIVASKKVWQMSRPMAR